MNIHKISKMLQKIEITDHGDTTFLNGEHVNRAEFKLANDKAVMENKGRVTSSLKRMIAWVSSNATGCRYCQAHAIRAAERYGAESEKLDNIWDYKTHEAFNDAERAALDFALAASQIPNSVDKDLEDRLKTYWNDGEVVEILGVISLFGFLNRWNDTMGTSLEAEAVNSAENYLSKNGWNKGKHI